MSNPQNDASHDAAAKAIDFLKGSKIAMVTSVSENGLHAHPMTIQKVEENGDLWFILPGSSEQAANVQGDARVNVAISKGDSWVSVGGQGRILRDQDRIDEFWSDMTGAFFEGGKDDPDVALLFVTTSTAEYWDTPGGKLTAFADVLKARVTGEAPKGENEETTLP